MSDPVLTEFWRQAPPPWNTLGPEIAAGLCHFNRMLPYDPSRWARELREARATRALSRAAVAEAIGVDPHTIWIAETDKATKAATIWAKLSAFYGITLE